MYFLLFVGLLVVIIPVKNMVVNYIKLFICSFICFYYLDTVSTSILGLLLSLISFLSIILVIYRILRLELNANMEDNTIFSLAHEVKNPLAVCKGYLDMLDINDKDKLERYIPIIKSEMNRSLDIMNEFLYLKRIKIDKELMDLSLLLEDVKKTVDLILKNNNVNINISDTDKELIINGDYDKLKQVFINLIKNSYEAGSKNIKIDIKKSNNYLEIKVIDDGIGISKADLKKVGNIFYTTKVTGTGIGVSLSKEIIRLHDGDLSYNSILNKGTTATMILPFKYIF